MRVRTYRKLIVFLSLCLLACVWGSIWLNGLSLAGQESRRAKKCALHLEELALAFRYYAEDYDSKLPDAKNWVDALQPYVKDKSIFHCPSDPSSAYCSYGMNLEASGRNIAEVSQNSARTVLLFETAHSGRNPFGGKADVVKLARHYKSTNPNPGIGIRLHSLSDLDKGGYYLFVADWEPMYVLQARSAEGYLQKNILAGKESDHFHW